MRSGLLVDTWPNRSFRWADVRSYELQRSALKGLSGFAQVPMALGQDLRGMPLAEIPRTSKVRASPRDFTGHRRQPHARGRLVSGSSGLLCLAEFLGRKSCNLHFVACLVRMAGIKHRNRVILSPHGHCTNRCLFEAPFENDSSQCLRHLPGHFISGV